MNNDLNGKWYTAKDIKNILGISSGQLFHWGQTWGLIKPEVKGGGRAYKNKYSFMNLLDIALIKELNEMGFEPSKIKDILKPYDHPDFPKEQRDRIWNSLKAEREDKEEYFEETGKRKKFPGYDKAGCLILIGKEKEGYAMYFIGRNEQVLDILQQTVEKEKDAPKSFIIIDLLKIVREVEEKTGEKL